MESNLKTEILEIIARAHAAREQALRPENLKNQGYSYAAGYLDSALALIEERILKSI